MSWKSCRSGLLPQHTSTPEITETDDTFYITVDTAGYSPAEMSIKVVGNPPELRIAGLHECSTTGLCLRRQFNKNYILRADVDVNKITSRRSPDGVLQVSYHASSAQG